MKHFRMSTLAKLYAFLFMHIGFIILSIFQHGLQIQFLLLGFLMSIILGILGREIAFHRLWTHRSFQTYRFIEYLLMPIAIFMLVGSSIISVGVHRTHHAYSDSDKDPDFYTSWIKSVLFLRTNQVRFEKRFITDLLQDPMHVFSHRHYFLLHFLISILLLLIFGLQTFAHAFSLAIVINFFLHLFFHKVCHSSNIIGNYRNFNTKDLSHNNRIIFFFHPGYGLHNNHHASPNSYDFALGKGEFDPIGWFIKVFLIKK